MLKERNYPVDGWAKQQQFIGEKRGEKRGADREGIQILMDLIEHRFGSVAEGLEARVREADPATRRRWIKRCITAPTLDDVFADD